MKTKSLGEMSPDELVASMRRQQDSIRDREGLQRYPDTMRLAVPGEKPFEGQALFGPSAGTWSNMTSTPPLSWEAYADVMRKHLVAVPPNPRSVDPRYMASLTVASLREKLRKLRQEDWTADEILDALEEEAERLEHQLQKWGAW